MSVMLREDMEQIRLVAAGRELKRRRQELKMTHLDLSNTVAARFGEEHRVSNQQISKLERGTILKPSMAELVHIGEVLGLSYDDIGVLYGWRSEEHLSRHEPDPRVKRLSEMLPGLPPDIREGLLMSVELAMAGAVASWRERGEEPPLVGARK